MTVAFVLSGGGTRGAFEVGAAQFLYDVYNIRPDIITATSVGAINGAKLAEGGTPLEKRTAPAELTAFWLGLNNERDMWEQAEWLLELGDLAVGDDTLRDLVLPNVTGQPPTIVHAETPFVQANVPWLLDIRALLGGISQLILTLPPVRRKAEQGKLRSILRLRPIEHKMRGIVTTADTSTMGPKGLDATKVRSSGVKLRLAMVSLETGALRYATEDGRLLERDNHTPVLLGESGMQVHPDCAQKAAYVQRLEMIIEQQFDEPPLSALVLTEIAAAKAALPAALQALQDCERGHPPSSTELPVVDLTTAVIASCTMPAIFEPRLIGGEHYVDGGAREIAPVEVAFQLGGEQLEHVYIVLASTQHVARAPSFATADFMTVMLHALVDLGLNEITHDDAFPPGGWPKPCDVIAPTFDLYNPTVVDPGLIRIHSEYGFMRAADVARRKPPPRLQDSTIGGPQGSERRPGRPWPNQPDDGSDLRPAGQPSSEPVRPSDLTPAQAIKLSDAVTLLRLSAWDAECDVFGRPHVTLNAMLLPYHPADTVAAVQWILPVEMADQSGRRCARSASLAGTPMGGHPLAQLGGTSMVVVRRHGAVATVRYRRRHDREYQL